MSVESEAGGDGEETSVDALGRRLGEAITELPEYEAFEAARGRVEADEDLQERITEFEQQRREFAMARQTGDATEEDLADLRRAQQRLHSQPLMAEYLAAKDDLVERLAAINEAISEPLAVDFGGEAGGCCHD